MSVSKYLMQAIKDRIKEHFAENKYYKEYGIKKFEILDIWERNDEMWDKSVHRFHILVKHKDIEDGDNCTAFQIFFYGATITLGELMFDGRAILKDGRFIWNDIYYGSFTKEMSSEWLKNVEKKIAEVSE